MNACTACIWPEFKQNVRLSCHSLRVHANINKTRACNACPCTDTTLSTQCCMNTIVTVRCARLFHWRTGWQEEPSVNYIVSVGSTRRCRTGTTGKDSHPHWHCTLANEMRSNSLALAKAWISFFTASTTLGKSATPARRCATDSRTTRTNTRRTHQWRRSDHGPL